jgi:putative inorganic carbon (HCO3(-)) transporter
MRRPGAPCSACDRFARAAVLVVLPLAPLAMGAVYEDVFVPLLVVVGAAGLASLWAAHAAREPLNLPGGAALIALVSLVVFQTIPLPASVLAVLSPGSLAHYQRLSLVPVHWRPISVNPADTARGLAFLIGMTLLYVAVTRQARDRAWPRRVLLVVVATSFVMTLAALVQAASPHPHKIYGLYQPRWDWAVFGPYVNHNHFAGYLALATPLAFGWLLEAHGDLRRAWDRRGRRWLALGDPAGAAVLRRGGVVLTLMVGLLASGSRGGLIACVAALAIVPMLRGRPRVLAGLVVLALGALLFVDVGPLMSRFTADAVRGARFPIWRDAIRLFPDFPWLGVGFNAFSTAYPHYQTIWIMDWLGETHNDYLQILLDLGLVGAGIASALLAILARAVWRAARGHAMAAGLAGGLLGMAIHNIAEFNWQIPANAATFVVLAGLAVSLQRARLDPSPSPPLESPIGPPAGAVSTHSLRRRGDRA